MFSFFTYFLKTFILMNQKFLALEKDMICPFSQKVSVAVSG